MMSEEQPIFYYRALKPLMTERIRSRLVKERLARLPTRLRAMSEGNLNGKHSPLRLDNWEYHLSGVQCA